MEVSVALATHNSEGYLRPLLQSLAAQEHPPSELVVRDDASADGTLGVLAAFAAEAPFPVRVHPRSDRRGFAATFLEAAAACSGDAVAFCDADDVWRADKLALCAAALERTGATLVLHATEVVDADLRPTGRTWPDLGPPRVVPPLGFSGLAEDAPGMAMVFRRAVLEIADPGARPPSRYGDHPMLHDEWVLFLAGVLGPVQLLPDTLVRYRQHGSNASSGALQRERRLTLAPALDDYERAAAHTAGCAEVLERTRASDPQVAARLADGARAYRAAADQWRLRVALHTSAGRRRRGSLLRTLVSGGAYRERTAGGFGRLALAKDVASLTLGPRAPR